MIDTRSPPLALVPTFALALALSGCAADTRGDFCGDGALTGTEQCDDGNAAFRDGCDPECRVEAGWDCYDEPSVCERDDGPGPIRDAGPDVEPADATEPDAPSGDSGDAPADDAPPSDTGTDAPVETGEETGEDAPTDTVDDAATDAVGDAGDTADDADAGDDTGDAESDPVDTADAGGDAPGLCADVDCSYLNRECVTGICDPETGDCRSDPFPDGAGCDDGDLCTEGDRCDEGTCIGRPITCGDGLCAIGECDPETGECDVETQPDGTTCDADPTDCRASECQEGACVDANVADDCTSCGDGGTGLCIAGECGIAATSTGVFDFEDGAFPPGITQSGNANWRLRDGEGLGGSVAARSGNIGDSQTSTVTIPFELVTDGAIVFSYRVESESGLDALIASIDGDVVGEWSGITGWNEARFAVPAGAHTLTLTYDKDFSISSGDDAAWIDDLTFEGSGCPGDACGVGVLAADTCHLCPLLDEGASCDPDPADCTGAVCESATCVEATLPDCTACGADGTLLCASGLCGGMLQPGVLWDFEGGGLPSGFFTSGSGLFVIDEWSTTTSASVSGSHSASNDSLGHSSYTYMSVSYTLAQPGSVSFWLRTSTEEDYDYLYFSIDGELVGGWSGETPWTLVGYPVTAGTHTYEWEYDKDGSTSEGSDRVWVDDIVVEEDYPCSGDECSASIWDGASCIACPLCE